MSFFKQINYKRAAKILFIGMTMVLAISQLTPTSIPILGDMKYSCYVGVQGFNVGINIRGLFAGQKCREQIVTEPSTFFEKTSKDGTKVCEWKNQGYTYIVYDTGRQILGHTICASQLVNQ